MKRRLPSVVMLVCIGFFSADASKHWHSTGSGSDRAPNENITAVIGATVIDGTGAEPSKQTVVIRGDRIEAEGMTLIPGLFDLHTHLPYSSVSDAANDWPKNLKAYL